MGGRGLTASLGTMHLRCVARRGPIVTRYAHCASLRGWLIWQVIRGMQLTVQPISGVTLFKIFKIRVRIIIIHEKHEGTEIFPHGS